MQDPRDPFIIACRRDQLHDLVDHIHDTVLLREQVDRDDQSQHKIRRGGENRCRHGECRAEECSDLAVCEFVEPVIKGVPVHMEIVELFDQKCGRVPCRQLCFDKIIDLLLTARQLFDQRIDGGRQLRNDHENDECEQNHRDQSGADGADNRAEFPLPRPVRIRHSHKYSFAEKPQKQIDDECNADAV